MWTYVFAVTTAVSALSWAKWKIIAVAFMYYMKKKQYKKPSDEEIAECVRFGVKYLFRSKQNK